ncbi:MAG: TRIC cation channel family protein [Campylobacter sp.]|nr:TRIC cation channel family protein [Campylobacter sp.]
MDIILIVEYIGIASAALSGFLFAVKKGCDWLGIFVSAFLTALGGGITRDVLVGREMYSFTHYMPVSIVILMLFVSKFTNLHLNKNGLEKKFIFIFADAIDVICFSIVGAIVATEYKYNIFGVVMIAFCNGVGGGILRDILLNEIPWFLRTGLYGTISMGVGFIYFVLHYFGFDNLFFILVLLAFGIFIRMLAFYRGWKLPDL